MSRRISRRQSRKIIAVVVAVFVLVIIAIAILIIVNKKEGGLSVTNGHIAVVNGIEGEEPTISVFNMFITPDEVAADSENVILKDNGNKGRGYLNNCVFLGDSRTVAMVSFACVNDDDALAQIGISHMQYRRNQFTNNAGKQYTLQSYLASHQKPVIYVSLGVNGMNGISEDDYEKSYTELVDYIVEAAPNSAVVLMSIWPVNDNGSYSKTVQNSWISKYNDFLYRLAKEKKLYFLNINEILTSSNGQIKSEYDAGDGLHYNKNAYDAIMKYIISHPVPGVSCEGDYTVKYIPPRATPQNTEENGEGMDDEALMKLYEQMLNGLNPEMVPAEGNTPTGETLPTNPGGTEAIDPYANGNNTNMTEVPNSPENTSGETEEENNEEEEGEGEDGVSTISEEELKKMMEKLRGE